MKTYDLIMLGDLVADIIMPIAKLPLRASEHGWADGLFTELGGGCTTLVAARRVGLSVATLGMLGADDYGEQVLAMLATEGVDISRAVALPGRKTVVCVVVTDKAGQHVFLGIKDHLPPERCPADWQNAIPQARCFFTNGYTLRDLIHPEDALKLIHIARQEQIPIFYDPGPSIEYIPPALTREVLQSVDVMVITEEEARFLLPGVGGAEAARGLLSLGPRVVVVKAGASGCYVATDGLPDVLHHPGFAVPVIDTVGAGDAFVAAFIAAHMRGGDWRECAAVANAMGAAMVATQGAGRCVPQVERLAQLLKDDPARRLLYAA